MTAPRTHVFPVQQDDADESFVVSSLSGVAPNFRRHQPRSPHTRTRNAATRTGQRRTGETNANCKRPNQNSDSDTERHHSTTKLTAQEKHESKASNATAGQHKKKSKQTTLTFFFQAWKEEVGVHSFGNEAHHAGGGGGGASSKTAGLSTSLERMG